MWFATGFADQPAFKGFPGREISFYVTFDYCDKAPPAGVVGSAAFAVQGHGIFFIGTG